MVKTRWRIVVVLAVLAASSPRVTLAQAPPVIDYGTAHLERHLVPAIANGSIAIDGVLDEADWARAPLAEHFIQNDPKEGQAATFDTKVRMLYDNTALYFGVFAIDDQPARIIVSDIKEDFNTGSSDGFRVVIDTFKDGRNGYQFATNPGGAKWDAQISNEGRENNADWDGIWDVATRVTEGGWYAEFRIPLLTLKFSTQDTQTWGLNFERKLRRLNEDSYWSPLPRVFNVERVSLAGSIDGMRGLRPGRNLRVKPYALGSANTVRGADTDGDVQGGLDVKYGVTTGLTWDFTVNTDFSQVEADEQQINLSRFSLLFPEKRDFFLENSGIFQFGGGSNSFGGANAGRQNASPDLRLFFSRRIGLSDAGETIPILGGTRLTGRMGAYSLGVLNIQQRSTDDVRAANFTALRVRRDILTNSDVGVVLLNKAENGGHYNRVGGVDANFRFGFLTMNGSLAKTQSPQETVAGQGNDLSGRAGFNYQSRVWQFRGTYATIGERFNDEMGFVPRLGVNNVLLYGGWATRPRWARALGIREIRPHWQFDTYSGRNGRGLESRYQDWHLPFNFNNGGFLEVGVNPNVEEIRRPFTINSARGIKVQPRRYEFNEYFVLWNTNSAARLSFNLRYTNGDFYDGYKRGYIVGPTFRPNERFNASVSLQINDISLLAGSFVTKLVTTRVNYNFTTKMFLNALLQYNNDTHQLSSNLRFNFIHRPLSDFFLVYNERRDERSGDLINRALIAKMTYLVAF